MDDVTFVTGYKMPFDGYTPGMAAFYGAARVRAMQDCAPCQMRDYAVPAAQIERQYTSGDVDSKTVAAGAAGNLAIDGLLTFFVLRSSLPWWIKGLAAFRGAGSAFYNGRYLLQWAQQKR